MGEQGSNLFEGKANILIQGDERKLVNGVRIVAALAAQPHGRLEQTNLLVITQC